MRGDKVVAGYRQERVKIMALSLNVGSDDSTGAKSLHFGVSLGMSFDKETNILTIDHTVEIKPDEEAGEVYLLMRTESLFSINGLTENDKKDETDLPVSLLAEIIVCTHDFIRGVVWEKLASTPLAPVVLPPLTLPNALEFLANPE